MRAAVLILALSACAADDRPPVDPDEIVACHYDRGDVPIELCSGACVGAPFAAPGPADCRIGYTLPDMTPIYCAPDMAVQLEDGMRGCCEPKRTSTGEPAVIFSQCAT